MKVGVIGGSYGGLCAALALRCVGHDVEVFERNPDFDRIGGGIVVQPDFAEYLEAFGYARPESAAVPTTRRRFLARDGSIAATSGDAVFYTAWDTLLRALRDAFDASRIHNGMTLRAVERTTSGVTCKFDGGQQREFDLVVAADGIGSLVRRLLLPDVEPKYAGYVGYRGLVPERELSEAQAELIRDSFVLYAYPRSHILNYLIPSESGSTQRGERRWNWVWYVSHTPGELTSLLTDRNGHRHRVSLAPGEMSDEWSARLRARAERLLPPLLSDVVRQTRAPFAQAIFDLAVPRMVFGRIVLLGDAACVVRPHTASGTSKAAADAISLAHVLRDHGADDAAALSGWEAERLVAARQLFAYGQQIASRGGLGEPEPM
ncbi:MAG: 2,6-dihydroxypyridine 3-monooxygenase [Phycisphaerae bacterium]|nr:2,6-dihydroxypyridine 3-monooxygenase [Phycisphaerae bacterium]